MKPRSLLLSIVFILNFSFIQSQEYLEMIDAGTYPVQEIIDSANAYFEGKDKGRGTGYKPFKRWEYNALRLVKENGYLPTITENLAEWEQYNAYLNQTAQNRQVLEDNWEELGPENWNATTSWNPGVGRITGIAIDKTNSDHIVIGANTGGVWRTTDAGQSWTPLSDNFSNLTVYSVAIDPTNSDTYFFGSSGGLMFKSEDAGATWNPIGSVGNSSVNKILINPGDTNIMYASASNAGIYRSDNGGSSWTNTGIDSRGYDIEFKADDTSVVFASGNGFHKSTDNGVTFTTIGGFSNQPKMIGVSPADPDIIYVLEASGGSFGGFYVSTTTGDSFIELDHTGRNYFGYDTAGFQSGGQAPRDMDIAVNPNDINEVHIAGVLTWRSMDGGVNFTCTADWIPSAAANANIGYCHADVDILEFNGSTLFAGTDGGIFKAEDTANLDADYFTDITTGIGIRQFYKIGISQTQNVVVTGGSQDNGTSFYTEAEGWKDWLGADGMEGFVDKDNTNVMYGMIQFGGMYRTDDAAASIVNIPEPGPGSGEWVTPFEQDPSASGTVYVGYDRVYRSVNTGIGWSPISQVFGGDLDHLKIAPSNNQVIYAANATQLYRTQDGGATNWEVMTPPGGNINSIAVHPLDPNKIAVAITSGQKVRVSEDGGDTWESYQFNLPNFSALAVVWQNNDTNGLYVGMNYGIYYIDDTFTEWQPYSNNLPNVIINELEINEADGKIYAGSYGRGLWASPVVADVILGTENVVSNSDLTLYPNPAEDILYISLPYEVDADIRVFDLSGKLLIYKNSIALERNYALQISGLNSGVYFVRINSEKGTVTKRFIKR
ncbi:T9SS type A sorting domain-containing protein [Constantimarinum furrinae]|uniref:Secretion system C-terminal sorting domain-containing protein n=1 Tax=Constantimarinum furrinae TaxID=2562285 RepID=A0A7G8PVC7_9FLAO|nr:T9SS type A sorting domain-containing protein [Constantimarinum furrinae]QNJ98293.1 hypothetical protein ALE3EI_1742 [Constantimarinum furrinae]